MRSDLQFGFLKDIGLFKYLNHFWADSFEGGWFGGNLFLQLRQAFLIPEKTLL
jgi:hypothetical protein